MVEAKASDDVKGELDTNRAMIKELVDAKRAVETVLACLNQDLGTYSEESGYQNQALLRK